MTKQFKFSFIKQSKLTHGGEHSLGKRKAQRPLKMNKPIHVVLRAKRSGLKTQERKIQKIIKHYAERFKIKVYQKSVNSNHIHLILSTPRRDNFQNYLRSITGLVAKLMGNGKLWLMLAFSRVANWGKEYNALVQYIIKNRKEALGVISYTPRTG